MTFFFLILFVIALNGMNIITLTTDFGERDYYVGAIKGGILTNGVPVVFADISHRVSPYNIVEAAFILRNSYPHFPKGTIHLVSVHNFYDEQRRFLAIQHEGHYFIGPDNGVFSLVFEENTPELIFELDSQPLQHVFGIKDCFSAAVGHLLHQRPIEQIGVPINRYLQRLALQPIIYKNQIRGSVIHIDHYANIILNIRRDLFDRIGKGRAFELYFKRYDPLTEISHTYADVPVGEPLCLFNSAGYLELAVNAGEAATLFGLETGDTVQIDFV